MGRERGRRGCVRCVRGIAAVSASRDARSATTHAAAGEGSPERIRQYDTHQCQHQNKIIIYSILTSMYKVT